MLLLPSVTAFPPSNETLAFASVPQTSTIYSPASNTFKEIVFSFFPETEPSIISPEAPIALIAPLASVSDGMLDVLILKRVEVSQISNLLLKIVQGDHINHPNVEYFQTKKIHIGILNDTKVVVDYDGECFGELPVTVEVAPKAVKFIVPRSGE